MEEEPMLPADRTERAAVDQLVEEHAQRGLTRRELLLRGMALGLSAGALGAVLEACGSNGPTTGVKTVDLITTWGSTELANFQAVLAPFKASSGITVNVESTRDLNATLTSRIRGNNPPGIAVLPNPGKMQELAAQNSLTALDSLLDMSQIHNDYSSAFINLGTVNGKLYAIFYKAANKGTVWYDPAQFTANGYSTPTTWDALISLSNQIAGSGKYPWSMGVESGSASGWPATDWISEIYINESGPDMYDKWVKHQIPWTDPSIKSAFQKFGAIVSGSHYINGAPQSILATNFTPACYPPFRSPPTAYMNYLGDFAAGFIITQFPSAKAGTDYNFFNFPTVNPTYQGALTGGVDVIVAMKNDNAVQALIKYMATADAQKIWVQKGGFTSVNKSLDLSAYPDAVTKASAQQLTSASTFRVGAGDLMPSAMQTAWWAQILSFIKDTSKLDSILSSLESTAGTAYTS
jgi:alpha-glucoside transport system substrate-binding protein